MKKPCYYTAGPTSGRTLVSFALLLISLLAVSEAIAKEKQGRRPNIVFFLVDDFGKGGLASMGSDLHETPNIDTLVKSGMRFTNGYAACTVCSPSRAAILTGRYPGRTRLTDWIPGKGDKNRKMRIPVWNRTMDHERVLLPEALKKHGYATAFIGKWHLGPRKGHSPTDHGFDVNVGGREWGHPKGKGGYFHPFDMPNVTSKEGDYLTDRLTDYAVDFIKEKKDKPFLLYMSYYTVHGPLQGRPDLVEKYKKKIASGNFQQKNAVYAAMCESLDMSVGRVLDTVKELGLDKDTIVVFTGDNGAGPQEYTGGLKNRKGYSHEGGVREPVVFAWPGKIKPGSVSNVPMTGTDYYPTLLDLAGLPLLKDEHMDGVSLKPILQAQGTIPERSLFWHYPHYHRTNPKIAKALASDNPWKRYWGFIVCSCFMKEAGDFVDTAKESASNDKNLLVRTRAAEFLGLIDAQDPGQVLLDVLGKSESYSETLLILNTVALMKERKPGYDIKVDPERIKFNRGFVSKRIEYLTGIVPEKKPKKK